ncbi:hypothetical protein cyc_04476 [Cyclospora cayetanensis]|uniref:Transmembrane protein n=1 Tax=Cyclospora cayetanensis TaxID=88456 RepID=A0A1D3D0A2_9EIME|nr:hypothetical protein cyc_04476 [Cyclospora cayetanensis]
MASGYNSRSLFSVNLEIPYDKNHLFRLVGTMTAFTLTAINSTDSTVAVNSRYGLLLVVLVEGWLLTWFQLKTHLCNYADNIDAFKEYEWQSLFNDAYGAVDRSTICENVKIMVFVATGCLIVSLGSSLFALILAVVTRHRGNPELRPQQHLRHCGIAIMIMGACMAGIILPPIVFTFMLPDFVMLENTPVSIREGVFVGALAGVGIIPAIVGYHLDKSVLKSKMEFETLIWTSAYDENATKRQKMLADADALEAAKMGGLVAPADLARQAVGPAQHSVDKYLIQRTGPWR